MNDERMEPGKDPATVEQIGAAMAALGFYSGENTPEEHAAEAARRGGPDAYRMRLVNALLGAVQAEVVEVESGTRDVDDGVRVAAWEDQLRTAGAGMEDPVRRVEFIRWQVLRAGLPLRQMATSPTVGPIPVAAAHAVEGLHLLLGVVAASQDAVAKGDVDTLAAQSEELQAARQSLQKAIDNTDVLLNTLKSVGL